MVKGVPDREKGWNIKEKINKSKREPTGDTQGSRSISTGVSRKVRDGASGRYKQ